MAAARDPRHLPGALPCPADPGDTGWHIDPSFGYEHPDFLEWRANVTSQGRALLLLFLFSDIGPDDAPTRIRRGSHLEIARQLEPAGAPGLTLRALAADGFASSSHCPETLATDRPARSTSVTPSWFMPPKATAAGILASWPSRRSSPRTPQARTRGRRLFPVELAIRKALAWR